MLRQEILNKLSEYKSKKNDQFALESMGVFGSVAKGENSGYNDIDVFVELSKPDMFILGHIKADLEEIFQTNVDVVRVRDRMNEFLKNQINNSGIYV